jgi:hypothetical protein
MIFQRMPFGKITVLQLFLIFLVVLFSLPVFSQRVQPINLEGIRHRKVRKFIEDKKINLMPHFASIQASWKEGIDKSTFSYYEKEFYLNDDISNVWKCYNQTNPTLMWNGHFVKFDFMISKCSNSTAYFNNKIFPEMDTGQVYFLDLRLMRGLFNVPIAFEIINIDPIRKIIEFSYIKGNKSLGKQSLQFLENGDGRIRIIHGTYYKSDSKFRDHFIYPYFHKKLLKEFHRNMRHLILNITRV